MKKSSYIIIVVSLMVALLYGLAHMATPTADLPELHENTTPLPPAPYPADFESQLAKIPGISIHLHDVTAVPQNIPWSQHVEFPAIGSTEATKGGTLRLCNVGPYPANFLAFGSPTPQFFHYNLFDCIEVPLVREHPDTGQEIPGIAEKWAQHEGKLWFYLHPKASYSNGRPVRAADFALYILMLHKLGNKGLSSHISGMDVYGDSVLAITPAQHNMLPFATVSSYLRATEPGFYREFSSDYEKRYANRIPPTTGAYTVGKTQRGRCITLQRIKNWWAAELPGFRYTCNVDYIEHHFLTDEAQAWEFFLRGKLDLMQTRNIVAWQDYLHNADARIIQHTLNINYPMPPYGIAINAEALPDVELRRGLMQAMDMQHAMNVIFRGEADRLPQFSTGYRHLPHKSQQYQYAPDKARACFAAAGYTKHGADGILRREDGTKLSIRLAYTPSQKINTLVNMLVQSAAACGLEIVPEPLPWQNCSDLLRKKQHHMLFWATVATRPIPNYRRHFHSSAAGDDAPFCLNNEEMDQAICAVESATTPEETVRACAAVDSLIQRLAIWLPGWMENRAHVAAWKHVKLPVSGYKTYDVVDSHTLWINNR